MRMVYELEESADQLRNMMHHRLNFIKLLSIETPPDRVARHMRVYLADLTEAKQLSREIMRLLGHDNTEID